MNFRQFVEDSYRQKDIPDKFYLVANLSGMEEMARRGSLTGVKGITASTVIIPTYYAKPNKMIVVMNGPETEQLNSLSKVQYNPNYMASRNLAGYSRVLHSDARSTVWKILLNEIKEKVNQRLVPIITNLAQTTWKMGEQMDIWRINNANDFANRFLGLVKRHYNKSLQPGDDEDIKRAAKEAFEYKVNIFKHEEEWIVKNNVLKIPYGSVVIVKEKEYPLISGLFPYFKTRFTVVFEDNVYQAAQLAGQVSSS